MDATLSAETLYQALGKRLELSWVAGRSSGGQRLSAADTHWGGATLVGHLNLIHPHCVQVLGSREFAYLQQLDTTTREHALSQLLNGESVVIVVGGGESPDTRMIELAEHAGIALLVSPLATHELISTLRYFLSEALAETTTTHGVFMEVLGTGLLLTGDSNVGKSELALELITRGHRLVADDAPEFARITPDILQGRCPHVLQDMLEVRGLGILNVRAMYGDNAIKLNKYLRLIIDLRHSHSTRHEDEHRLYGITRIRRLLGVEIPVIEIPVAPSRNLAVLVEASVRKHLLLQSGYDAADDLIQRQQQRLESES
ncbi:HPr(Ser) kinase/phosphatase [Acidihalobacter yilgarnensis]|uniref:HPr kinase/phosphorylase n=1 Tax=Acidihalobacter yilgarnensis TaxID=2819280 RepID=A0A1D8IRE8_9GAMM|nr:HPr(Ser) kinase/phosphatase [Acidihalobacter yilgarnensis]AOU99036.1 HPr(Ser) kinase/phosphatase [Acidihalobacter yilgarnensis]